MDIVWVLIGRAVGPNTIGLGFGSSHLRVERNLKYLCSVEKTKNKRKRNRDWPI